MKKFLKRGEVVKKNYYSLWFSILEPERYYSVCVIKEDGVQGKIHVENYCCICLSQNWVCKVTRTHWKCCSHIWKYFLKQKTFKVSGFKHSWAFFAPKSKLMLFIIKWRKDHKQPSPFRMLPGDLLNRSLFFIIYTVFPAFCTTERGGRAISDKFWI